VDILKDEDGKTRGPGSVTSEHSFEAVQAISMLNGQLPFDRPMHMKMDERTLAKGDFPSKYSHQLPRGLGMGLGPRGQPIDANHMNKSIGRGSMELQEWE
jgi:heterogeneous nuclear ribonucleoprotein M